MSEARLRRTLLPRGHTHIQTTQSQNDSSSNQQNPRSPRLLRRGRTVLRKVGFTTSREKHQLRHSRDRPPNSMTNTNNDNKIVDHKENFGKDEKKTNPTENVQQDTVAESSHQPISSKSETLQTHHDNSDQLRQDHTSSHPNLDTTQPQSSSKDQDDSIQNNQHSNATIKSKDNSESNLSNDLKANKETIRKNNIVSKPVQQDRPNIASSKNNDTEMKATKQFESQRDSFGTEYQASLNQVQRTGFVERSVAAAVINAARQRGMARKSKSRSSMRPPHHRPHGGFCNPWDSARHDNSLRTRGGSGSRTFFHKVAKDRRPPDEELASLLLLAEKPDFHAAEEILKRDKHALVSFWLGHCTFLLRARGLTILTDPVWSPRLGPLGPKRVIPPPCEIEELPDVIDVVILSSACYDHYDKNAVQALGPKVNKWLVPLGLKQIISGLGIDEDKIVELDWWQETSVKEAMFVCTPAQHYSVREDALWCSWVVQTAYHRFFFCGATGYRSVDRATEDTDAYDGRQYHGGPSCPVFKEINRKYGGFDTALLPIGGFKPRALMSGVQGDAIDMLFIHQDLGAKRSVAHRWGTYAPNDEGLLDAVRMLENGLMTGPVAEHEFSYLKHGRLHET